jgi:hypothetical protein
LVTLYTFAFENYARAFEVGADDDEGIVSGSVGCLIVELVTDGGVEDNSAPVIGFRPVLSRLVFERDGADVNLVSNMYERGRRRGHWWLLFPVIRWMVVAVT